MSEKSSIKAQQSGIGRRKLLAVLKYVLWVALCFVGVQLAIGVLASVLIGSGILDGIISQSSFILAAKLLTALAMAAAVVFLPSFIWREATSAKTVGTHRLVYWRDIGWGLLGVIAAYVGSALILWLSRYVMPWVDIDEVQNVGVTMLGSSGEMVLAMAVFVVLGPIVEEIIFRGYLYGKLRQSGISMWISSIVVSVLFGLFHWQWNVALDVFVLSMIMCYLRERTSTIWPGVIIHMIKNGIAFYLIFIYPMTAGL